MKILLALATLTALLLVAPVAHAGDTADAANCVSHKEANTHPANYRMSTIERSWAVTGTVTKTNHHGRYLQKEYAYCDGGPDNFVLAFWSRNKRGEYMLFVATVWTFHD